MTQPQRPSAARRGVRYDFRGVVIGPWSDSVKRTNALLNKTRRVPLPEQFRSVPYGGERTAHLKRR